MEGKEDMPSWLKAVGSWPVREEKAGSVDGNETILKASFSGRYEKLYPSELTFAGYSYPGKNIFTL
jgi:hypothetical protein